MNISELFRYIVLLSLLGSVLAIGLFLTKLFLRQKLSANWHYYIWFVLVLRLVVPFTPASPFSVLNLLPQYPQTIQLSPAIAQPSVNLTPTPSAPNTANTAPANLDFSRNALVRSSLAGSFGLNWATAALVWLTGILAIMAYLLVVNGLILHKSRKQRVCADENIAGIIEECRLSLHLQAKISAIYDDSLKSPALLGLFRPKIIISPQLIAHLSSEELRYIFLHELSHLKRRDLLVNSFVTLVQIIYWFNPLIWYALRQMKEDCEFACDATALANVKPEEHKKYAQTIIDILQLLSQSQWAPGTIGFAGKFNSRRIVMISTFGKTKVKWTIAALALTLVVGCASLSNPINPSKPINPTDKEQNQIGTVTSGRQNAGAQALIDDQIDKNLAIIMSSPKISSNPQEYINAHQKEYNSILTMDARALPYLFSQFEKGGQTGLKGQIMEKLCRSILGGEDIKYLSKNPQDWYDTYKEHIRKLAALNGLEYVQKHYPKGSLVLSPTSTTDSNSLVYKNTQYDFSFLLPERWKGYSIVNDTWQGADLKSGKVVATGPMLSIRHPQWTPENQRQDIPIMIFTVDQWNALEQGEFHIGAAPVNPSELGRNIKYVFALPARYNYAFQSGYQEVEKILANKPLQITQASDATTTLLLNMMQSAEQGKVINSEFPVKTTSIDTVKTAWGKPDQTDYVAAAKGSYATFGNHNVVFGFNKGNQIFEVRSIARLQFARITQNKAKEVLGISVYDTTYNGQEIIGYPAGAEFKIEMVFPQSTTTNPDPPMDHYNVLYPEGTANDLTNDPGRQW